MGRELLKILSLSYSRWYTTTLFTDFGLLSIKRQLPGSAGRYVAVVLAGNALDATFFYIGHDLLGVYDFLTIVISTGLLACVSFFTHRLFTFHNDPWKRKNTGAEGLKG